MHLPAKMFFKALSLFYFVSCRVVPCRKREAGSQKPEARSGKLKPEAGSWKPEDGNRKLEAFLILKQSKILRNIEHREGDSN